MDTQLIFQQHQLMHFIMPVILMILFSKKLSLRASGALILLMGMMKEVRDRIMYQDPFWLSGIDIIFDIIGIALGILVCSMPYGKLRQILLRKKSISKAESHTIL